ncbi:hypothetical protein [Wolbachia endosymbiont of Ctenocephalides felis wCfeJ]|uniref:hypothetical protein n=1 Tax=Wolbachia endosymbiont of Ctenocephalides felis wCfeJ TaxID=2732594 RepID=UPI0014461F9F|nr:hypothetical protein [Wolbachia endosymbiont of Ctenocephalides felis wCfeJ]WCR57550.1 MAG: hypothetical protein PG980_000022 [Wolbachia endosymbiont of Ctenocephalides felis wCfeJ]
MREYRNSTEHKVKNCINGIADVAVSFGIGIGLVVLGFTSPAAIGAITAIASLVVLYPLGFVIDKIIERFFPEGSSKQPDSSVSNMEVGNADKNRNPEQLQYV